MHVAMSISLSDSVVTSVHSDSWKYLKYMSHLEVMAQKDLYAARDKM